MPYVSVCVCLVGICMFSLAFGCEGNLTMCFVNCLLAFEQQSTQLTFGPCTPTPIGPLGPVGPIWPTSPWEGKNI